MRQPVVAKASGGHGHDRSLSSVPQMTATGQVTLSASRLQPSRRAWSIRSNTAAQLAAPHTREVFSVVAERAGTTIEAMAERARTGTLLGRLPALAEVADFAAFAASDRAGAMTGAIANLTCGPLVDRRPPDQRLVRALARVFIDKRDKNRRR